MRTFRPLGQHLLVCRYAHRRFCRAVPALPQIMYQVWACWARSCLFGHDPQRDEYHLLPIRVYQ